eukprot:gene7827-45745_t
MPNRVFVVGVGMTRFCKPQKEKSPANPTPADFARVATYMVTMLHYDEQVHYDEQLDASTPPPQAALAQAQSATQ